MKLTRIKEKKFFSFSIIFIGFIIFLLHFHVYAQSDQEVFKTNFGKNPHWEYYNDITYHLYSHLSEKAFQLLNERNHEVGRIQTPEEWKQRQSEIKAVLMKIVGPFPEKSPLNAEITKTLKKPGYTLEHIVYESIPGYKVTSTLFIPDDLKNKKAPAILYCSGHYDVAYRSDTYQQVILNLVKKGFVVFAFDPVGQGERIQYYDPETKKSKFALPTHEHSYPGAQAFIIGSSVAKYFIWDGIRAIDYLMTREEVDHERIGITGRSGGGTQSAHISALDDRIHAAAPECWITNYTRIFQSVGPQDGEQNLYKQVHYGIDHSDFLVVRAPKPTMIITTTNDFFNIHGAMETEEEVSRAYKAFGKPDNFSRVEDYGRHESTKSNREAMYAFFQKHLDNPGNSADEEVHFLTEEELKVTSTGQLATSMHSETVFSLNKKQTKKLISNLNHARSDPGSHLSKVVESAKTYSSYEEPGIIHEPILTGKYQKEGFYIEKYFMKGGGDYVIPFLIYHPIGDIKKVLFYIHPNGKKADPGSLNEIEWFAKQGYLVLIPDLLGTGETYPSGFEGDAYIDSVSLNIWFGSVLVNKSIAGIRSEDVKRLMLLVNDRFPNKEIHAITKGAMAPVMLHTATFNKTVKSLLLIEPYSSYSSIAMHRRYSVNYINNVVPGAINKYDLPDLAACIAPRRLVMVNVNDGSGQKMNLEDLSTRLDIVCSTYQLKNAGDMFEIVHTEEKDSYYSILKKWIDE